MKSETAKQLKNILDDREQQKREAVARSSEEQTLQAKNLADFAVKKDDVIRPALHEIVEIYRARAIPIRIEEQDERPNPKGGIESAAIKLDLGTPNAGYDAMRPQFTLTFDKRSREVALYTSTRSQSGPAGKVSLDTVTADWIHDAFLKYESGALR